jgi:hypothetical protein
MDFRRVGSRGVLPGRKFCTLLSKSPAAVVLLGNFWALAVRAGRWLKIFRKGVKKSAWVALGRCNGPVARALCFVNPIGHLGKSVFSQTFQ